MAANVLQTGRVAQSVPDLLDGGVTVITVGSHLYVQVPNYKMCTLQGGYRLDGTLSSKTLSMVLLMAAEIERELFTSDERGTGKA